MSKVKLKPCPFCGAQPEREKFMSMGKIYYSISCTNEKCFVQPFTAGHINSSIPTKEWNKRARNDG